jgi:hypothetical protein
MPDASAIAVPTLLSHPSSPRLLPLSRVNPTSCLSMILILASFNIIRCWILPSFSRLSRSIPSNLLISASTSAALLKPLTCSLRLQQNIHQKHRHSAPEQLHLQLNVPEAAPHSMHVHPSLKLNVQPGFGHGAQGKGVVSSSVLAICSRRWCCCSEAIE